MMKLLRPPLELVSHAGNLEGTAVILVDCGSVAKNHLLSCTSIRPVAVIDHHQTESKDPCNLAFDVRPHMAATATIAASYLREQRIRPQEALATALVYAIRTETRGGETFHSRLDRSIISWLTAFANPSDLAEIESAPLSRSYFSELVLALQNTFIYGNAALCFLPSAEGADVVGEVGDLLIRCEGVRCALCAAPVGNDLMLSVRTKKGEGNAARLVHQVIGGLGPCGGHQHRAGGKIEGAVGGAASAERLYDELRGRWLLASGAGSRRGTRLVAKREIMENL